MKIVDYRVTPIAFSDPPLRAAMGLHAPYALRTIVEIVADDGAGGRFGFENDPDAAPGWATDLQHAALSAETLVEQAQSMCKHFGFKSLKLKAGVLPPEEEVRTIKLLRAAFGPEMPLRIDPNAAWTVETSLRW